MRLFKNILTKIFKTKNRNEPWLDYYSREERSIKFTEKSIYDFMVSSVGEDKDFIALNYFENRKKRFILYPIQGYAFKFNSFFTLFGDRYCCPFIHFF